MEKVKQIYCADAENWEIQEQNKELRRLASDQSKVDEVKKSDMVSKKKYEHIEQSISLIDKLRLALMGLAKSSH